MEIDVNNISTIASMVWGVIISPILIAYGVSIDNVVGTSIVSGFILLCLLVWSACNPNKMKIFGNKQGVDDGL
jgi:uncharacterized membrane protein YfcA